ncbi:MAG: BspA family leucine-rich repeat surface protein [Proteobacteria bacterium]|nr:BspA family leucine-rich repeat surface protein [Pseudomonadota bacterium]
MALLVSACDDSSETKSCDDISCDGHGMCIQNDEGQFKCECEMGYHVSEVSPWHCELDIVQKNGCDDIDCGGHGKCILENRDHAICDCDSGYHVSESNPLHCELDYVPENGCDGVDCGGHGICIQLDDEQVMCDCDSGYQVSEYDWLYCEPNSSQGGECDSIDCGKHGICIEAGGVFEMCLCEPGYSVTEDNPYYCEPEQVSELSCYDVDCGDNGFCSYDKNDKPYCVCAEGYIAPDGDPTTCVIDISKECENDDATCIDNTVYRCIDHAWTMIEVCKNGLVCRANNNAYVGGLCGVPCESEADVGKTGPAICNGYGQYSGSKCESFGYGMVYIEGTGDFTECMNGCYAGKCITYDENIFDCKNRDKGSYCTNDNGVATLYYCDSETAYYVQPCSEYSPYCFDGYFSNESADCVHSPDLKYCDGYICSYESYYPCAGKKDGEYCVMHDGKAYKYECSEERYKKGFYFSDYCGESDDDIYCVEFESKYSDDSIESVIMCAGQEEVILEACTDLVCDYDKLLQCKEKADGIYPLEINGHAYFYQCKDGYYYDSESCGSDAPYVMISNDSALCVSESYVIKESCEGKICHAEDVYPCKDKSDGYYCLNNGDEAFYYLCQDGAPVLYESNTYYTYFRVGVCEGDKPYCISHSNKYQCVSESDASDLTCSGMVCEDECPNDSSKLKPGICGCGVADKDSDKDGTLDCLDECPNDKYKVKLGICGCGRNDTDDEDNDGVPNCVDVCPLDPLKTTDDGVCGCGVSDLNDRDCDGSPDDVDECPDDPYKHIKGAGECATDDVNLNHMFDKYETGDGKDCLKDSDCSSGFCDSFIGYKCSSRCTSDAQCVYSDYYCRGDGRCVPDTFETVWHYYSGSTVTFPISGATNCNFTIDWGDGSEIETYTSCPGTNLQHTYDHYTIEWYRIKVKGTLDGWSLSALSEKDKFKLREVVSFGPVGLSSGAFSDAQLVTKMSKVDIPDATKLTNMNSFFEFTYDTFNLIDFDLEKWDVRNVTEFYYTFERSYYNKPLNRWNVSSAKTFYGMFLRSGFNQPLNLWDVSGLKSLEYVFYEAYAFDQSLADWNIPTDVDYAPSRFGFEMFEGTSLSKDNFCDMITKNAMWKELYNHGKFGVSYDCE